MSKVQKYTMTQEQFDKIIDACKPVPAIALQCGMPPSPQENANAAWASLGREMGFDGMTAKSAGGASHLDFVAVPVAAGEA